MGVGGGGKGGARAVEDPCEGEGGQGTEVRRSEELSKSSDGERKQ